jgi:hypothetical protein
VEIIVLQNYMIQNLFAHVIKDQCGLVVWQQVLVEKLINVEKILMDVASQQCLNVMVIALITKI